MKNCVEKIEQKYEEVSRKFAEILRSERCKNMSILEISSRAFERIFTCLNRLRYNRERASQSLEVIQFILQFTPQEGLERREATAREILELEVIRRRDVPREAVASLQRDDVEEGEHCGAAVLDLHDLGSYGFLYVFVT